AGAMAASTLAAAVVAGAGRRSAGAAVGGESGQCAAALVSDFVRAAVLIHYPLSCRSWALPWGLGLRLAVLSPVLRPCGRREAGRRRARLPRGDQSRSTAKGDQA